MKEFRPAFFFLLRFVGFYLVGNFCYGIWIESYGNSPDPVTHWVTMQSAQLISLLDESAQAVIETGSRSIALVAGGEKVIGVFEGCNGINVMIVYASFLVALQLQMKKSILVVLGGFILLHVVNLIRIILLFLSAQWNKVYFYYFHKYLFTAGIYVVVIVIWWWWLNYCKRKLDEAA